VRVLAPISGIVIRRGVEIGEVVASGLSSFSGGTQLFQIGDPSQMIVRGDIAEIDIGKLRVGQDVDIVVDAYPDTTYRGRVRWIAPVGEKKQGSPIVTFDTEIDILDREPRLRQGMSCDIDVIFSRRDSTLYLPMEVVLEVFDDQEEGKEEVKGRRGRFLAYAVRPAPADSAAADSTAADSLAHREKASGADTTALLAADASAVDTTALASASSAESSANTVSGEESRQDTAAAFADTPASAPPDSTPVGKSGADTTLAFADTSASALADSAAVDTSAAADSTAVEKAEEPPQATLDDFVEVELEIGLETSTRIEILSGLEEGEGVAEDSQLIRRKKEEQAKKPKKEEKKGWF